MSIAVLILCCLITTPVLAAELKKPGPSPSDALFDPSRVIQIEIRLDPKDWHALRISHRNFGDSVTWNAGLRLAAFTHAQ